jgi:general secretion pathway protein G
MMKKTDRCGACRQKGTVREPGFTLMELLVVLAIVALLLTLAAPRYFGSVERSKEVVLRQNLRAVRDTIDSFHADTGRYPQGLEELVERGYLRAVPIDPYTEASTTWRLIGPQDQTQDGVFDIHSSAEGTTHDGQPLSTL